MNAFLKISLIAALTGSCLTAGAQQVQQSGVRRAAEVIQGVWRAGGKGGTNSLTNEIVVKLCEAGVSNAFYLYPETQFGGRTAAPGEYDCRMPNGQNNTLKYEGAKFVNMSGARKILEAVQAKIQSGNPGQILFHCWNGHHATGEIAAYIRMQFCGYSADQAGEYFAQALGHAMTANERSVYNRIKRQSAFRDLGATAEQRAAFCR